MISGVKRFGAYVRTEFEESECPRRSRSHNESNEAELFVSPCAIPSDFIPLELVSVHPYNHDTSLFRFLLPLGRTSLNLPIGSHLLIRARGVNEGKDAIRPYTSLSSSLPSTEKEGHREGKGYCPEGMFDILVKRYDEWGVRENPASNNFLFTKTDHSFRPRGLVSSHIHSLAIGDRLDFKHTRECAAKLPFPYPNISSIMMIAVGIGVAPMLTILQAVFALKAL